MKNAIVSIEGQNLDLYPDTVITQTLKAFSIGELGTMDVNYTNQFDVPFTQNNDRILEGIRNVSAESLIPYRKHVAKIEQGGIDTVQEGICIVDGSDESYKLSIYSGAKGFFDSIAGKKLSELSGFGFQSGSFYIAARRNVTDDVIFPVGYYGTKEGGGSIVQDLSFIFLHSVFERIFTDAGYTYNWTPDAKFYQYVISAYGQGAKYAKSFIERLRVEVFVETPQVIYPTTDTPIEFTGVVKAGDPDVSYWSVDRYISNDTEYPAGTSLYYVIYKYTISITVTGGTVNIGFGGNSFTPDLLNVGTGTYSFQSDPKDISDWETAINLPSPGLALFVYPNVNIIFSDSSFYDWTNEGPDVGTSPWMLTTSANWTYPNGDPMQPMNSAVALSPTFSSIPIGTIINGSINVFSPTASDGVMNMFLFDGFSYELINSFPVVIPSGYLNSSFTYTTTQANNIQIALEFVLNSGNSNIGVVDVSISGSSTVVTINAGSLVIEPAGYYFGPIGSNSINYYAALMPDINQSDLIKEVAVKYGLQFEESNGVVSIKRMNDIIADRYNAPDWSRKRVNRTNSQEFAPFDYAQSNFFRYIAGNDLNNLYGQGVFTIDNEVIDPEKTVYTSFSTNTSTRYVDGFVMADVAVYDESEYDPFDGSNSIRFFDNDAGSKLLLIRDKYSYEPDVEYVDGNDYNDYSVVYFDDPNQYYTMKFQQDIDDNYPLLVACLQRSKIVTREYMLTEMDIANFSFFFPVFDNGEYFLVNAIKDFIQNGVATKVELFKI